MRARCESQATHIAHTQHSGLLSLREWSYDVITLAAFDVCTGLCELCVRHAKCIISIADDVRGSNTDRYSSRAAEHLTGISVTVLHPNCPSHTRHILP